MSLEDVDKTLFKVEGKHVTLEAFVRIRDKRVLEAPTDPKPTPNVRIGGTDIRLPIMGNMLHKLDNAKGSGYQLSCGYDEDGDYRQDMQPGPICCAEAYTETAANTADQVRACLSIVFDMDRFKARSAACDWENAPSTKDCGTGWFHITGHFDFSTTHTTVSVMVKESSSFYSQSQFSGTRSATASQPHRKAGTVNGAAFRLGATLPFDAQGEVTSDSDMRYLFLRCDLDEVKVWVQQNLAHSQLDAYNQPVACQSPSTCGASCAASGLAVYIQGLSTGNTAPDPSTGTKVRVPTSNGNPGNVSGVSGANPRLSPLLLAVGVTAQDEAGVCCGLLQGGQCPQPTRHLDYKHEDVCGQTYIDRRVEVVSSAKSTGVTHETNFQREAFEERCCVCVHVREHALSYTRCWVHVLCLCVLARVCEHACVRVVCVCVHGFVIG